MPVLTKGKQIRFIRAVDELRSCGKFGDLIPVLEKKKKLRFRTAADTAPTATATAAATTATAATAPNAKGKSRSPHRITVILPAGQELPVADTGVHCDKKNSENTAVSTATSMNVSNAASCASDGTPPDTATGPTPLGETAVANDDELGNDHVCGRNATPENEVGPVVHVDSIREASWEQDGRIDASGSGAAGGSEGEVAVLESSRIRSCLTCVQSCVLM